MVYAKNLKKRRFPVAVTLEASMTRQLKAYGDDSLSRGVAKVVAAVLAHPEGGRRELPEAPLRPPDKKQSRGRQPLGQTPRKKETLYVDAEEDELLGLFGGGNRTEGVIRAAVLLGVIRP